MARPSTKPVSGMRDHLPEAAMRRREAVRRVETAFLTHGFQPLETPAMERLDTLLGKYGEEGDQLIYRVLHRGERLERALGQTPVEPGQLAELGLRYDLTVPLARVIAEHQAELPPVFRRFQIQPVWRADRAQKGRFREFTQCDADIVGSGSLLADAEILTALEAALAALGFSDFTILLNHREVLRGVIAASGVGADAEAPALVALDKLGKAGREPVEAELTRLAGPAAAQRVLELTALGLDELGAALPEGPAREGADDLRALVGMAAPVLSAATVRFDPSLARGLSYYTGPIFEVVAPGGAGSLAGGGRYDRLVGMFRGRDTPATGFALGMERILMLVEERGGFVADDDPDRAMLCPLPGVPDPDVLRVARALRRQGVQVELQVDRLKLGRQLARADAAGYRTAYILGPDELGRGEVTVRDLGSGEQSSRRVEG